VKINGKLVKELGVQVQVGKDKISVQGELVNLEEKLVYIIFNKPKDTITTMSDEKGRTTVMKVCPCQTTHLSCRTIRQKYNRCSALYE